MTDFTLKQFPELDQINEADIADDDGYMVFDQSVGILKRTTKAQSRSDRVTSLPDITALSSINTAALVALQQFSVGSYVPDTSTGSALLRWRPDLPKSRHDGVLFFSLTVPMFTGTDTTDYRNGVGETDPGGNGVMELVRGEIIYYATVLVPSHYSDMQTAIDELHGRVYVADGASILLSIESGHAVTSGVALIDGDYRKFKITSEDAEVPLDAGFSPVPSTRWPASGTRQALFALENCHAPILDTIFTGGASPQTDIDGYMCGHGGEYIIKSGAGVKGFRTNFECRAGKCDTDGAIFANSAEYNARYTSGTFFSSRDATFDSAHQDPVAGITSQAGGVLVSRGSFGSLQGITVSNQPYGGVSVRRSRCSLIFASFSNIAGEVVSFFNGGVIDINSDTTVDGSTITPADTTLGAFNGVFGRGLVFSDVNDRIEIATGTDGFAIKFPDGLAIAISNIVTLDVNVAEGSGFRSSTQTIDFSDIIDVNESQSLPQAFSTSNDNVWVPARMLSGDRVNAQARSFVSLTSVDIRVAVVGVWLN